eukprot:766589_1
MSSASESKHQRIFADMIIPGLGNPIYNAIVIVKDGIIDYVDTLQNYNNTNNKNLTNCTDFKVPILMPGLWDCHTHFLGQVQPVLDKHMTFGDAITMEPLSLSVTRAAKLAHDALMCGYTSCREVGGYGCHLRKLIDEGTISGPNIYSAGKALSITGGHGDAHNFPLNFVCCANNGWAYIVDGTDQCLAAVRKNIRDGAQLIKIMCTGGIASISDPIDIAQFNRNEIKCIVEECKKNRVIVAAHCHGKDGIELAINNGVYSIEHGTYLNDELCKKMNENGCVLIPTRYVMEYLYRYPKTAKVSPEGQIKIKKAISAHRNSIKCAIRNDVTICSGSDCIYDKFGNNTLELKYYVDAGMSELKAIQCATANGPLSLGQYKAPKTGQIKCGYDADLIAIVKKK